jgi:phage N-6-adenine-methyltransferase
VKIPRPRNHPQQVAKRGSGPTLFVTSNVTDEVDTRLTPDHLWRRLDDEFHFTVDVAASASNAKCERFYDIETDGLAQSWAGDVVWCNPPYSAVGEWVRKAHLETGATSVLLIPANRTEQPFWQEYIEPYRDRRAEGYHVETRFLAGRQKFITPGAGVGGAPFASVLVIWWGPCHR